MLSRSESQKINKSERNKKAKAIFLRSINFVCKSYMYLGLTYFTALTVVSIIYKSYWHQEPPFNYQRYIQNNSELMVVLITIITSFLFSGLVAIMTERKKKPVQKNVEKKVEKKVRRRRTHRAA